MISIAERANTTWPAPSFPPGIMQKPGIPAHQMQRTGTHEGLAGAERAKTHSRSTRNTPRNLAASHGGRGRARRARWRGGSVQSGVRPAGGAAAGRPHPGLH